MLSGKSQSEMLEMANNMAAERGKSLAEIASEYGVKL